ncbi:MAG: NAD(P)/FAD-dependent oxidoreductase [Deltaproteobacteria bacterium]|nr:NAD(P)/FAD-dependent oxidoreductase [Deltaproteobacteria bacterium]
MMLHDIIIIGAGPAGSRIAQRLSQLGYSVVVVDKNLRPGDDVCCTGILSQECLGAFGLDNGLVLRQASSAKFLSPSGEYLRLCRQSPVAAIVDRSRLNMHLAKTAEASGARYLFGARVSDILLKPDGVEVIVNGQSEERVLRAKAAVISTGFGSALPAKLGLGEIKQFVFGAQVQVSINGIDEVEVYFDQKLTPGGFAWLVPTTDGRGLVGLLTRGQADSSLENLLEVLSSQGKIASSQAAPSYDVVPLKPLPRTYADRVLVVGEAAGQVKPTTGGGVYYGLLCADIAAGVLQQAFEADDFSAHVLSAYEDRWRAKLNRELVIGYWARTLLAKLSNDKIDRLFRLAGKKGLPELISDGNGFSFDWHGWLLLKMAGSILPF